MNPPDVLCIGAVLWDSIGHAAAPLARGDDRPGRVLRAPGGVALNVGRALAAAGLRPTLLGAVGDDPAGAELAAACTRLGIGAATLTVMAGWPTDRYLAIEDPAGLVAAVADARTLEAAGRAILAPLEDGRLPRPWTGPAVIDGNLPEPLLAALAGDRRLARAGLRCVPASPGKALRLRPLLAAGRATLCLNRAEAEALAGRPLADAASAAAALVALGAARALVTDGAGGAADAARGAPLLAAPAPAVIVRRVTGAGDAFLAAHLAAEARGADRPSALAAALAAAAAHVASDPAADPAACPQSASPEVPR